MKIKELNQLVSSCIRFIEIISALKGLQGSKTYLMYTRIGEVESAGIFHQFLLKWTYFVKVIKLEAVLCC